MKRCGFSATMLVGRCGISVSAMQSYMTGRRSLQKFEAGAMFQMVYELNADPRKLAFGCSLELWEWVDGVKFYSCFRVNKFNKESDFDDS